MVYSYARINPSAKKPFGKQGQKNVKKYFKKKSPTFNEEINQ